jgi:hypothetical protein
MDTFFFFSFFDIFCSRIQSTVKPRYKVPQYNGNFDIKEVFVSWIKDVV